MGHDANLKAERHQNVKRETKNALERIESLEQNMAKVVDFINQNTQQLRKRCEVVETIIEAVVTSIGPEEITRIAEDIRKKRILTEVEEKKQFLSAGLENKTIIPVEAIESMETIITGIEKDAEGKVLFPDYIQLLVGNVQEQSQRNELINAKVGYVVKTATGGTFEVTGAYKMVEPDKPAETENTPATA
jgi:hypothetical protein